ncbi:MAG: MucB/RseB C-terminal domain-containing protein [Pseudomonadota bacterium]
MRLPVFLRSTVFRLLAAMLLAAAVPAATLAADDAVDHDDRQAGLDLLRQAGDAWRSGNFRGRFFYVRGNRMDSMQVVHAVFDGVEHERLSHLDNTTTEIIRRGDETICIHPDSRLTRLDAAGAAGPFRAFAALEKGAGRFYIVRRSGQSRVAGRSAEFVEIWPRDFYRYGYRLWIDSQSRLPLRYEVVNRKGAALESVEFADIETGIEVPRDLFALPSGPRNTLTLMRSTEAPMPTVSPSWLPPGFRVTGSQTQRLAKAGDSPEAIRQSSSVTYSDGLASFSLFVEQADVDARPMGRQIGPTVAVSGVLNAGNAGRFRVTLVGEVPAGAAVKVVESTRYRADPPPDPEATAVSAP